MWHISCVKGYFYEEHSLNEPAVVDFSEITPPEDFIDSIRMESSFDLAPTSPISPVSSSFSIIQFSLDPPESTFAEPETFMLGSLWLDQTIDDIHIERLEGHFEVEELTLGHPMSF